MIRKPQQSEFDRSPTVKLLGDTAEAASQAKVAVGRFGRKAGKFWQLVVLGWFSFGMSLGALDALSRHTDEMLTLRGMFATLVILAIPGGLIYATIRVWRKPIV